MAIKSEMKPLIEIKGLHKTYAPQEEKKKRSNRAISVSALKDINVEIGEGDFVIIKGPSGSGKTTLLNIIATIDNPTSGIYLWRGIDVFAGKEKSREQIRADIGYVFQLKNLLQYFDAIENVNVGIFAKKDLKNSEAVQISKKELDKFGLSDRYDHKPSELSGGERQRVAIARATAKEPSLIIADEPTGELDLASGIMVLDLLTKVNKEAGVTIVLVTHNEKIAQTYGKRLITMQDGMIIEDKRRE